MRDSRIIIKLSLCHTCISQPVMGMVCIKKLPEGLFFRSGLCFPAINIKSVYVCNYAEFMLPDIMRQRIKNRCIFYCYRIISALMIFISKSPKLFSLQFTGMPQIDNRVACFLVPAVPGIFAINTVGYNNIELIAR